MKKKTMLRIGIGVLITFAFMMLMLSTTTLRIFSITDINMIMILCIAVGLLSLLAYRQDKAVSAWRTTITFNLFIVGTLMSSLNIMALIGQLNNKSDTLSIFIAAKPLIYSIVIYLPMRAMLKSMNETKIKSLNSANLSVHDKITMDSLMLSRREREVIQLALQDLTNRQISDLLFIQESTVKKHLQNIYKKAQCNDRTELIHKVIP